MQPNILEYYLPKRPQNWSQSRHGGLFSSGHHYTHIQTNNYTDRRTAIQQYPGRLQSAKGRNLTTCTAWFHKNGDYGNKMMKFALETYGLSANGPW